MKSLKKKLMIILSSLVAVICLGLGAIAFYMAITAQKSMYTRDMEQIAKQIADTVEQAVEVKLSTLQAVANREDIKDPELSLKKKAKIMTGELETVGCLRMNYIDLEGNLYSNEGKTYNTMDRAYFTEAVKGNWYVSDPIYNKLDDSLVVIYAVPVYDDGKVIAVLTAACEGNELSNIVNANKLGETGSGFIVNTSGLLVADSSAELVESQLNIVEAAQTDAAYESMKDMVTLMVSGNVGVGHYEYNGVQRIAGYAPVSGHDWSVGIAMDRDEIYQDVTALFYQLLQSTGVILLLTLFVVYKIANSLADKIEKSAKHMEVVASGDLSVPLEEKLLNRQDEVGLMVKSIQLAQEKVGGMVKTIQQSSSALGEQSLELTSNSNELSKLSESITSAISEIAQGTSIQSEELSEINQLLAQFNEQLNLMSEQIDNVDESSRKIDTMAASSSRDMNELNQSVVEIGSAFDSFKENIHKFGDTIGEINHITSLITAVANQTNLLALNASIEAARAGEAGKGFAVVAEEIGNLAEQSRASSESINALVNSISGETKVLVKDASNMGEKLEEQIVTIQKSMNAFGEIVSEVNDIMPKIATVKASADEIGSNKDVIINKIDEVTSVSEEISASSEEISASTEEMDASINMVADSARQLNDMTDVMIGDVNKFKI